MVIRSCEARVIATKSADEVRPLETSVYVGSSLMQGSAPVPTWPPRGSRGAYMKSSIPLSSLSYPASVQDVGLDVVPDHEWIGSGGVTQNEVFDGTMARMDYSLIYGLPKTVFEEVITDGEDDELGEESGTKILVKACSRRNRLDALSNLKASRRVESRGFWPGKRVQFDVSPGSDGSTGARSRMQNLFDETLELMEAATEGFSNLIPRQASGQTPDKQAPNQEDLTDTTDKADPAEKADSDLSLDASNNLSPTNMSLESSALRYV